MQQSAPKSCIASNVTRWLILACVLLMTHALAPPVVAKEWYAASDGKPATEGGTGTMQNPWDLVTAMKHQDAIKPDDTIWFREGTCFIERVDQVADVVVELNGTVEEPIIFRAYPGERARIDARIQLNHAAYGKHLVFWGLEFFTTEWVDWDRDKTKAPAPGPEGGINLLYGENVKVINCFMHSTAGPINAWNRVKGIEFWWLAVFAQGLPQLSKKLFVTHASSPKRLDLACRKTTGLLTQKPVSLPVFGLHNESPGPRDRPGIARGGYIA